MVHELLRTEARGRSTSDGESGDAVVETWDVAGNSTLQERLDEKRELADPVERSGAFRG